jgi:hypothetical protein
MERLIEKLNGKSALVRLIYQIVVIGMVFWMFCTVRDFPAVYVSKADAQLSKEELRSDMKHIYAKLDSIEQHLRNKR